MSFLMITVGSNTARYFHYRARVKLRQILSVNENKKSAGAESGGLYRAVQIAAASARVTTDQYIADHRN